MLLLLGCVKATKLGEHSLATVVEIICFYSFWAWGVLFKQHMITKIYVGNEALPVLIKERRTPEAIAIAWFTFQCFNEVLIY